MTMPTFVSTDMCTVPGRGLVFTVGLDRDCKDFTHLIGKRVLVDGTEYHCRAVEYFALGLPWRQGMPIGLCVSEASETP